MGEKQKLHRNGNIEVLAIFAMLIAFCGLATYVLLTHGNNPLTQLVYDIAQHLPKLEPIHV